MNTESLTTILIDSQQCGVRIDRFIRKTYPHIPMTTIYRGFRKGLIRVNSNRVEQNYRMCTGDQITCKGEEFALSSTPSNLKMNESHINKLIQSAYFRTNFKILYEDEFLLICNKPSGLVVHSGTGHTTGKSLIDLAQCYMHSKNMLLSNSVDLIHRIDKDTSGIVLIAKTKQTLREFHELFRTNTIKKKYISICHSKPMQKKGIISLSLQKNSHQSTGMKMSVSESGVDTKSSFEVIESNSLVSKLEVILHTGKTHQIRVHCSYLNCPIVGDVRYGIAEKDEFLYSKYAVSPRLYLHAYEISFYYHLFNKWVTFTAPEPAEFTTLLAIK